MSRDGTDDPMSIARMRIDDELLGPDDPPRNLSAESSGERVPAQQLRAEIEATLLRNLSILIENAKRSSPIWAPRSRLPLVTAEDVGEMLKACAANLAQGLAGRVLP